MLECVVNVSEGRDATVLAALATAARPCLLDVHADADHNRSVFTLAGGEGLEEAVRALATEAVLRVDLRDHAGAHPRLGAVDVVPFTPLSGTTMGDAVAARDRFATWAATSLSVPCFLYGPERTLPEVRRQAFVSLEPDVGPPQPHPTAGAICAGARPLLIAYNLWLPPGTPVDRARDVAAHLRGSSVRALGLDVGGVAQVSLNLVDPDRFGPGDAYDAVASRVPVDRAELVGLLPAAVLHAIPAERWAVLDLDLSKTIEWRLAGNGPGRRPAEADAGN